MRFLLELAVALWIAQKIAQVIDKPLMWIWRQFVSMLKVFVPGPNSKIRLAAQWMWWQLTKVERNG